MRDYMNTPQVAKMLGVNIQTIRGYIRTGELAAARVGRRYVISREDVDGFVRDRKDARAAELASAAEKEPYTRSEALETVEDVAAEAGPSGAHPCATS